MSPTDSTDDNNNSFEYSLTEIEEQLRQMGFTDFSKSDLTKFQEGIQNLVLNDTTLNTTNKSSCSRPRSAKSKSRSANPPASISDTASEKTLSQTFPEIVDEGTVSADSNETLSLSAAEQNIENEIKKLIAEGTARGLGKTSHNNDDDAVSIISTTNKSTTSQSKNLKRKTLRNGIITQSMTEDFDDTVSLSTTITDYLEPMSYENILHGTSTSASKTKPSTTSESKSRTLKSSLSASKKQNTTKSVNSSSNKVNFKSKDDSYSYGQSLYDEKIDDFVRALLEGDETVLDDDNLSEISKHDGLDLANSLNKNSRNRRRSGPVSRSNSKTNQNLQSIDVEQLPPPPSFLRPSTAPAAGKRFHWHDPVKRYANYTRYWNKQPKCNAARDHRRTTQIKWQVRNELAELVRSNDEKFIRAREEMGDYWAEV